jgi:hypothetical protein
LAFLAFAGHDDVSGANAVSRFAGDRAATNKTRRTSTTARVRMMVCILSVDGRNGAIGRPHSPQREDDRRRAAAPAGSIGVERATRVSAPEWQPGPHSAAFHADRAESSTTPCARPRAFRTRRRRERGLSVVRSCQTDVSTMTCRLQANSCVAETLDDPNWFRVGRARRLLGHAAEVTILWDC